MQVVKPMCSVVLLGCLLSGQNAAPEAPRHLSASEKAKYVDLISQGKNLLDAGRIGDKDLIPPLKSYLGSRSAEGIGKENALMALAKLGDVRAQQEVVCHLRGKYATDIQNAALNELPYIGGWFAIHLYREFLTPAAQKKFHKAKPKPDENDIAWLEPESWALMELPKVVPNPPLPPVNPGVVDPTRDRQNDKKTWLNWINQHESLLRQLSPTGEGVDFSGGDCRHFKAYAGNQAGEGTTPLSQSLQ